ncbi:MAG: exodeoxyribonuclease I [Patescibacteria group bacterium]
MATQSFFFYDLETSGFNPREARIMQFAGQRTSLDLDLINEPVNLLIKITADVLPDPDAILLTGITPQKTLSEGITEAEFLKLFHEQIALPGTIFVGYNSIRFDDEFMRYLHYRNFYDPYEWQYTDSKSKWDLLDVMRMARALRPEGMQWPFDSNGKPSNRLELLSVINKIGHKNAHDALADVIALIELTKKFKKVQPKLFSYLLGMRDKTAIETFINNSKTFLYSSGKYPGEFQKTTIVTAVSPHPTRQAVLVYDLRYDPRPFINMTADQLAESWKLKYDDPKRLPVKTMQFNRCPAVAPIGVLDQSAQDRIKIDLILTETYYKMIAEHPKFAKNLSQAIEILDKAQQSQFVSTESDVDSKMYEGFFSRSDKYAMSAVRAADETEIASISPTFEDSRLDALLTLYKARNYSKSLNDEERKSWDRHIERKLLTGDDNSRAGQFFKRISELDLDPKTTDSMRYLLQELQLYAESILP